MLSPSADVPTATTQGHSSFHESKQQLGLRANAGQFGLLMLVNAFVGGMVGLERTVVPLIGAKEFGLILNTFAVSFIVSFGIVKACTNLVSGVLADRYGRKRILIAGWIVGLPVPFLIMWAPSWSWIVAANILLGINQGLAWSMAVVMKIDLVGSRQKGLAVGLNEFSGYLAVGVTAWLTGLIASNYALRPEPFYIGVFYAAAGLILSLFAIRETRSFTSTKEVSKRASLSFQSVFVHTTWKDRTLMGVCQAGLVNNLNDGMSWGILPLFFASHGLSIESIGTLKLAYPVIWAVFQLVTGPLSDKFGRKPLIVWGMILQSVGLGIIVMSIEFNGWLSGTMLLGIGTAMVYPALIALVTDRSDPEWRARSLSVYRFWRDIGYAIGALLAGITADLFGLAYAIGLVGVLTLCSGLISAAIINKKTHLPQTIINCE